MHLTIALVLTGLFVFGLAYNAFVGWLESADRNRGYTALLVVAGTIATLAGYAILASLKQALLVAACFTASGLPMIIGSIWRHMQYREHEEREIREIAREIANGQIKA